MSPVPPRWIDTASVFADLVATLRDEPAYAVDTEFHRERTYYSQLGLLQIAWADQVALVDPLAVDVAPLAAVLDGPGLAVMHAADQDIEVLQRACGTIPSRLFDTQLAAGFLGFSTPSLASIVERMAGVRLPKGDRLTDWLRRPLTDDQKAYAASDVAHLLEVHARLEERLRQRGRLEWALEECALLLARPRQGQDPETAWWRIKDSRSLKGSSRAVAAEVAAWRERRAAATDMPPRFVLPDLALVSIANRVPRDRNALGEVRGLDSRQVRGRAGDELWAAIRAGLERDPATVPLPPEGDLDRELRPAVTLASAWVSQLARELAIETALLATRSDIQAFLAGDPTARLARGWREGLVGERVRQLVDGHAALAFDGNGGLVLEERSNRPVTPPAGDRSGE